MDSPKLPCLAAELFWDSQRPASDAEWQRYGTAVIERVLERGDLHDFRELVRYYGHPKLRAVFASSRRLSARVRAFGAALYGDNLIAEGERCIPGLPLEKLWPY